MYKKITSLCFTVILFVFVVIGALQNISLLKEPIENFRSEETDFSGFIDEVKDAYTSDDFVNKEHYINLNGLFASVTNRNYYNEVVRLNNGMLTRTDENVIDFESKANNISNFSEYLAARGIKFTYVQAPHKADLTGTNFPVALTNTANLNADSLLSKLEDRSVSTVDLRQLISYDADAVQKYFYNTDHHWNNDGAFIAYNEILKHIKASFPEADVDMSYADVSNWETVEYERRFLGSLGKRVGVYYGGVDTYKLYLPKFDTDMYITLGEKTAIFRSGTFEQTNVLRERYLDGAPDYFGQNTYCTYIGGDYPMVTHQNLMVDNGLKVMIIKDSFTLPVQAFLSCAIERVDVIDPRYMESYSIAERVELLQPDIVIMMMNPSVMSDSRYYNFDIDKAKKLADVSAPQQVGRINSLTITAKEESAFKNSTLFKNLSSGARYVIEIENIEVLSGDVKAVGIALFDGEIRPCYTHLYINEKGNYCWEFSTPFKKGGELSLLLYAGEIGQTNGKSISASGITLYKLTD